MTDGAIGWDDAVARGNVGAARSRLPMTSGKWCLLGGVEFE